MHFQKNIEVKNEITIVCFRDENGKIQGTYRVYRTDKSHEIREDNLIYSQEYKDGIPISKKETYYYKLS